MVSPSRISPLRQGAFVDISVSGHVVLAGSDGTGPTEHGW